jgi:hypothetical protein
MPQDNTNAPCIGHDERCRAPVKSTREPLDDGTTDSISTASSVSTVSKLSLLHGDEPTPTETETEIPNRPRPNASRLNTAWQTFFHDTFHHALMVVETPPEPPTFRVDRNQYLGQLLRMDESIYDGKVPEQVKGKLFLYKTREYSRSLRDLLQPRLFSFLSA